MDIERMTALELAEKVGKPVAEVRERLVKEFRVNTFSDTSKVSADACKKLIEYYEKNKNKTSGGVRRRPQPEHSQSTEPAKTQEQANAPTEKDAKAESSVKPENPEKKPAEKAEKKPEEGKANVTAAEPEKVQESKKPADKVEKTEKPAEKEEKKAEKTEEPAESAKAPEKATPAESEKKGESKQAAPEKEEAKPAEPTAETKPAAKKYASVVSIASSNETISFDMGGNTISELRKEFNAERKAAAERKANPQRSNVRRESGTDNGITRRRDRNDAQNQRWQKRDNNGGYNPMQDKDKDEGEDKKFQSRSPKAQGRAKPSFEESAPQESGREARLQKAGNKDNLKKEKRIEGTHKSGSQSGGNKEEKYNSARQFIGGKMNVSTIESDDFGYSGNYDINSKARKAAKKKDKEAEAARLEAMKLTKVKIPPTITVKNFAELIKKTAAEVVKKLFMLGIMATMNQEIDYDTAALIAAEFEIEAEPEVVVSDEEILLEDPEDLETPEDAVERPPVVVVMGHVDHGKTSLLDAIRNTSVTTGEAGGITQHIGAYTVTINDHKITFLDTPGHEAFTAMRARGAMVTDVAIIVVAADDGVMPQTIEAINHAKAANVSIVVAVNKIDKEGANIDRVKTEMAEQGVVCEDWGGDVPFIPVSAKQGLNIDTLLETVLLTSDIMELKASPTKQCKGTIIEARLDKNKGPVATLLVQRGTLRSGDAILTESTFGHIRTMTNDKGRTIKEAGPSTPVEVTGLPEVPEAGKVFYVVNKDEKLAKKVAETRLAEYRSTTMGYSNKVTLEGLFSQMQAGEIKDLNIIVKADVKGSAEAIKASLEKLSNEEVRVSVIHNAVGGISESDVLLAEASNAIIIGFNVRPVGSVGEMAAEKGVDMKLYRVIYDAIDDVKAAMVGMLKPEFKENVIGHVEIRQTFKISGVGTIAGGYVTSGKVVRNSEARIVRDGIIIYEGHLASLKRFKDDVKEVAAGFECGLSFEKFDDLKEGDVIESYVMEQVERTL